MLSTILYWLGGVALFIAIFVAGALLGGYSAVKYIKDTYDIKEKDDGQDIEELADEIEKMVNK